jgi:hypothetical protein
MVSKKDLVTTYSRDIDMSALYSDDSDEGFQHDRILINNFGIVFTRTGKVRKSLPYMGIARRTAAASTSSIVQSSIEITRPMGPTFYQEYQSSKKHN